MQEQASIQDVRQLLRTRLSETEAQAWFLAPNSHLSNDLPINYVRAREVAPVLSAAHALLSA